MTTTLSGDFHIMMSVMRQGKTQPELPFFYLLLKTDILDILGEASSVTISMNNKTTRWGAPTAELQ
jgi:hypothetical protein